MKRTRLHPGVFTMQFGDRLADVFGDTLADHFLDVLFLAHFDQIPLCIKRCCKQHIHKV